jgi:hypothetical protein
MNEHINITRIIIFSVKILRSLVSVSRLVYQFIKLYAEVYTFTVSNDF